MKKKLSEQEVKQLIVKLRDKYNEYSEEYGKGYFDKQSFEDRYMEAIRTNMNMDAFACAEITFIEDLKAKAVEKKEEKRIKIEKPFTKKVEKYIEELEKKWEKYPRLFTSVDISDEAQYLCGAIQTFYNKYWLDLSQIINKESVSELKEYNKLTDVMQKFFYAMNGQLPYEVEMYLLNLKKYDIERTNMVFLKDCAQLMGRIKQVLNKISNKLFEPDERLNDILQYTEQIIEDFRFSELI